LNTSPRQSEILQLAASGLTDKEIALHLRVSYRTVRTHLERLYGRYRVRGRAAAVAFWLMSSSELMQARQAPDAHVVNLAEDQM
jgi:DNA-binding CsgD family transcriptional regulator